MKIFLLFFEESATFFITGASVYPAGQKGKTAAWFFGSLKKY